LFADSPDGLAKPRDPVLWDLFNPLAQRKKGGTSLYGAGAAVFSEHWID